MKHTFLKNDIEQMDNFFRRNFINSLSGFKSINLVGTINKEGITNLAPFSQVFHIGANPALMGMLVRPESATPHHTLPNIEEIGYFTCNHIHTSFYKQAHQCAARYQISEFEACGLTPEFSAIHPAPYLKESYIQIGLKFEEKVNLKINGTILVVGAIIEARLNRDLIAEDGFIDLEKAGTITSSGLDSYHISHKLARLSYPKPDKEVQEI